MSESPIVREKFWELPLDSLNDSEWELLCDHCGRCCLKKLQDEESEKIYWTRIICRYHEGQTGHCGCYSERSLKVPECLNVKDLSLEHLQWMPNTCAYRLRMENKPLLPWHPLLVGSEQAMVEAGITAAEHSLSEDHVHPLGYHEHIIRWVESE